MDHAELDAWGVAWRLFATLFVVLLNGFFVAAEFALVKLRRARIDALAEAGRRSARVVQHIVGHLDRYLSACQLGITLASLILGALGEPAVSVLIIAAAHGLGIGLSPDATWLPVVSIGLAFALITILHMTLGEQAPKMWALRRAEGTAMRTALPLRAFTWLFDPLIGAINAISNAMLRLVGLPPDQINEPSHTAEEIRSILSLSATAGHISDREYEITENVFRMVELEVRHIVVGRADVDFLSLERTDADNLEAIRASGHSRLPLCEVGLDSIVGFVHTRDVLARMIEGPGLDLKALAREALFVPDTMSLSTFIQELQTHQSHCAAVVDERGTVIGLAFREDALEEIVGPLGDEFDEEPRSGIQGLPGGAFEVRGQVSLPEVLDRLDFELRDEEHEDEDTIGGHVTARLGRLPRRGDEVRIGPYLARVLEVGHRRVQRVRLELAPRQEGGEDVGGDGDGTAA